jgi:hypothetical protein
LAIYDELDACLMADPEMGGLVVVAALTNMNLYQGIAGADNNARAAYVEFEITVKARYVP